MSRRTTLVLAVGLIAVIAITYGFQSQRTVAALMQDGSQGVTLTEDFSDGRLDVTITPTGNLTFLIEVRLTASPDVPVQPDLRPEANFAMVEMHMDGIVPVLSIIGPSVWQGKAVLPMAGTWVVNIGFGEDFAETIFVAQ